ncbi:hypothetical protein BKA67DRAFT_176869 [Truncatella angustata]|uniref:Uncharacterized protein n=1 Tax=Truncatella angustata TaxID=152316 RepID=A0A9P8URQ2_9PEZI|nr:uncharacterized protein BKA67DRAFT_176869 [Truncatella angustata]KAH6656986.1 hypothetical protein BKA67DRAFT_176869 [Truncatella angustata]
MGWAYRRNCSGRAVSAPSEPRLGLEYLLRTAATERTGVRSWKRTDVRSKLTIQSLPLISLHSISSCACLPSPLQLQRRQFLIFRIRVLLLGFFLLLVRSCLVAVAVTPLLATAVSSATIRLILCKKPNLTSRLPFPAPPSRTVATHLPYILYLALSAYILKAFVNSAQNPALALSDSEPGTILLAKFVLIARRRRLGHSQAWPLQ